MTGPLKWSVGLLNEDNEGKQMWPLKTEAKKKRQMGWKQLEALSKKESESK